MGENALRVLDVFIPLAINIPFLTERYQDIFIPYASGIRSAFFGTIWVMTIAMFVSMPVSIGAAIYLEEYAKPRTTKLIQALVTNLAGVPSIVFGMFGLAIFVKQGGIGLGLGPSILAAGLTMGVMAMPIIVLASQGLAKRSAIVRVRVRRGLHAVASLQDPFFLQPCPAS